MQMRTVVAVLIFFGSFTSYMLRVDISIVIINISDISYRSIKDDPNCHENQSFLRPRGIINDVHSEWKPLNLIMMATLLSMYNCGYSFSILLSKLLAEKLGVVGLIGYSTLIAAVLTLLSPLAYAAGVFVLLAVRFLIGFLSGFVFPLMHILIINWSPMNERNLFTASLYGLSIGIIVTYPVSAYILTAWSWQWIFYTVGIFALIWSVIWLLLVTDTPAEHRCITEDEIQCIQFRRISLLRGRRKKIPWKEIVKSGPVQALFVLLLGNTWNLSFYIDYMPLVFHSVLAYDLMSAAALASLPILARMLCSWVCLPLARCLLVKNYFSVGIIRKFFTVCSHIVPAIVQLSVVNMICNQLVSTVVLIVVLGLNGFVSGGGSLNVLDLTPHFATSVFNAMQALLCVAGICMPYVVALILLYFDNRIRGWMVVLMVNASTYLVSGIVFIIFGFGSVEPWDISTVRRTVFHGVTGDEEEGDEDLEMHFVRGTTR